jgi:hypothetical protein
MPSTFSNSLRLELQVTGENPGTWGDIANDGVFQLLEDAIAATANVTHDDTADYTLTAQNGAVDEARAMRLFVGGTLTTDRNVVVPDAEKMYLAVNNVSGGSHSLTFKTSAGTGITVANGKTKLLYCDGTNVINAFDTLSAGTEMDGDVLATVSGTETLTNKTITDPTITIQDSNLTLQDNADNTKQLKFDLTAIATSTQHTKSWQNNTGTIYETGGTDVAVADGGTGASTASGARANLSAQQQDATLDSLSALGTTADRMAYTTGVDTWAETPITGAGRNLLDDASTTAQRTTLGLGSLATLSTVGTTELTDDAVTLAKTAHGTQGGVLVYGTGGAPTDLGAGTVGQVVTSQGPGATAQWGDSVDALAWTFFEQLTPTSGTTVVTTQSDTLANANEILFVFKDLSTSGFNNGFYYINLHESGVIQNTANTYLYGALRDSRWGVGGSFGAGGLFDGWGLLTKLPTGEYGLDWSITANNDSAGDFILKGITNIGFADMDQITFGSQTYDSVTATIDIYTR